MLSFYWFLNYQKTRSKLFLLLQILIKFFIEFNSQNQLRGAYLSSHYFDSDQCTTVSCFPNSTKFASGFDFDKSNRTWLLYHRCGRWLRSGIQRLSFLIKKINKAILNYCITRENRKNLHSPLKTCRFPLF